MAGYDLGTARGRIEIDASSLGRATGGLDKMGRALVLTGAVGAAAFVGVIKTAASFEKTLSAIGAISNASEKDMGKLRDTALDLGIKTKYSAQEVAKGMEDLVKAGVSIEDITGGAAEAVTDLAAAAGDELPGGIEQGAGIIANAMKTFEASAEDMNHFADVLVGAAASSTINVEDLATTLKYAGPIAHELGIDIDGLATAIAILGDRGIKGSTAGTSLRGVLLSLTPSSKKAEGAMKKLGYITEDGANQFYDLNGSLKPLPEVMEVLKKGLEGLSEQEKVAAYNAIFQRRAMNSALILAGEGAAGFDKYAASIAKVDAGDVARKKMDNLAGSFEILQSSVETLVIKAGTPLLDMIKGWVEALTGLVNWIAELDEGTLELAMKILLAVSAFALAAGSTLVFLSLMLKLYRAFIEVKGALILIKGMLATTFLANPVFLIIAAIVALGIALYVAYQKSETFRRVVDTMIDGVQEFLKPLQPAVDWIKTLGVEIGRIARVFLRGGMTAEKFGLMLDRGVGGGGRFVDAFKAVYNTVKAAFDYISKTALPAAQRFLAAIDWTKVLKAVGIALFSVLTGGLGPLIVGLVQLYQKNETFRNGIQTLISILQNDVLPVLKDIWDMFWALGEVFVQAAKDVWAMRGVFEGSMKVIKQVVSSAVAIILNIWNLFSDNLLTYIKIAWDLISSLVRNALQIIQGIIQVVTGIIRGDWAGVWDGIKNIFAGVWDFMVALVRGAIGLIKLSIETAVDIIHAIWDTGWEIIKNVIPVVWEFMKNLIVRVMGWIANFISQKIEEIKNFFGTLQSRVTRQVGDMMDAVRRNIQVGIDAVVKFFSGMPAKVINTLSSLASSLLNTAKGWISNMYNGVVSGWTALSLWFGGLPSRILSALGDVGSLLLDAGKRILQGLIDGIESKIQTLKNVLGSITDLIPGEKGPPIKDAKLLVDNGQLIMGGLMSGIESMYPALRSTLNRVTSDIPGMASGTYALSGTGVSNSVVVHLEFPVTEPGQEDTIRQVVDDAEFLPDLIRAIRVGTGNN